MTNIFAFLQQKRMFRSTMWQRNLAVNIFLGVFLVLLFLELLGLGFFLDEILKKPGAKYPPDVIVAQGLAYYYMVIFVMRFFIQELPTLEVAPLLHLPIKKSKISLFLNFRSLLSFFNFIPFFLFLPFTIKFMGPKFGAGQAIIWFAAIFFFEITSNFLLIWFKRNYTVKPGIIGILIIIMGSLSLLDKYHVFSISSVSETYFEGILNHTVWIVLPILTTLIFFFVNYRLNLNHLYLEDLGKKKKQNERITSQFQRLESFGITGSLILNEIRLLFRNKRSKSIIFLTPFLALYGLLFYPKGMNPLNSFTFALVGILVTGAFMIPYGQYILAWESRQFDFILSSNISTSEYFRAKFYIMVIPTVALYLVSIPYVFFGWKILWVNTVMFFYNVGINALLLLFTASFNRKRMELEKGQMMNYQGVGVNNILNAFPLIFLPWIFLIIFKALFNEVTALWLILIMGLLGILFHNYFIRLAVKFFQKNRYKIADGFRQS
ncbi:MAG: hypothetical protein IH595_10250 [Bacteroidales bacterium]|nr:hypothetical protein [Bacteroidales bacterium]